MRTLTICFAAAMVFANPPAAQATFLDLTWTGVTASGVDGLGLFGPVGQVPAGTPYVARFRYDASIGYSEFVVGGEIINAGLTGGEMLFPGGGIPSPLVSASITINGTTVETEGNNWAWYLRTTDQGVSGYYALGARYLPPGGNIVWQFDQGFTRPGTALGAVLDQPREVDIGPADNPGGDFKYGIDNFDAEGAVSIRLVPSHLSINVVPEPAALCMALLGVICLGGAVPSRGCVRRPQPQQCD